MMQKELKEFWIEKRQLPWLLLLLGRAVDYKVEQIDLEMIRYSLTATSVQDNLWTAAQLAGSSVIDLRFARDMENTDILFIELSFDEKISCAIEVCICVVQDFYLNHSYYDADLRVEQE